MLIPFSYEIINKYYKGYIFKSDVISSIKLAFNNAMQKIESTNVKYFELNYNKSRYQSTSKITAYYYYLFDCEYIDYWITNDEEYVELFNYNVYKVIEEPCEYNELDHLYYIDLISVFDKFFSQIDIDFELVGKIT